MVKSLANQTTIKDSGIGVPMRRSILNAAVLMACAVTPSFAQFGVGAKASTLGWGVEGAVAVTENSNVRGGFNVLGAITRRFSRDGIDYTGTLRLRSVEAHFDWFLWRGFRVSPGLLLYNGNRVEGSAVVLGGGRQFTIGGNSYYTGPRSSDLVNGPFRIDLAKNKLSPMITAGFGNLVRRTGSRFSVTLDAGIAFEGSRKARLDLQGSVGPTPAGPFFSVTSNPLVQADLRAEEEKINSGAPPYDEVDRVLKYYPVISLGFGFRLK
jgi:hypothetical protein